MTSDEAGSWLIVSQRRQVTFSCTVWITFHWRGTTGRPECLGVDTSIMEVNAAARPIVQQADGAGWQAMLGALSRTSGIATLSPDRVRQFDRTR